MGLVPHGRRSRLDLERDSFRLRESWCISLRLAAELVPSRFFLVLTLDAWKAGLFPVRLAISPVSELFAWTGDSGKSDDVDALLGTREPDRSNVVVSVVSNAISRLARFLVIHSNRSIIQYRMIEMETNTVVDVQRQVDIA